MTGVGTALWALVVVVNIWMGPWLVFPMLFMLPTLLLGLQMLFIEYRRKKPLITRLRVTTESTVIVRQFRTTEIPTSELRVVAQMHSPQPALRIETSGGELVVPAGNLGQTELAVVVDELRRLVDIRSQGRRDDAHAERLHGEALRRVTTRSESQ